MNWDPTVENIVRSLMLCICFHYLGYEFLLYFGDLIWWICCSDKFNINERYLNRSSFFCMQTVSESLCVYCLNNTYQMFLLMVLMPCLGSINCTFESVWFMYATYNKLHIFYFICIIIDLYLLYFPVHYSYSISVGCENFVSAIKSSPRNF